MGNKTVKLLNLGMIYEILSLVISPCHLGFLLLIYFPLFLSLLKVSDKR